MTFRKLYLREVGASSDVGILWCLSGSGGTTGSLRSCADIVMEESALYLASQADLVIKSCGENLTHAMRSPGVPRPECEVLSRKGSPPRTLAAWLTEQDRLLASLQERYPIAIVSPPSEVLWQAFHRAEFKFVPSDPHKALVWDNKPEMHLRLAAKGVPRPSSWIVDHRRVCQQAAMPKTVVVKGPARRPTVISSSAIAELAPQNVTVLVEDYHEEALSLNF